jgi:hypothetical protein
MHACMHAYMRIRPDACAYIDIVYHTWAYVCAFIHVCMYACVYVYVHVCVYFAPGMTSRITVHRGFFPQDPMHIYT